MRSRSKKIFLALSIAVPFALYCMYYYGMMVKNAPYKFSEMESITFKYGLGDSLINQYNSKTGEYQYLNDRDSLVKTNVRLSKDNLLYLHRKAADLGFWNFPSDMRGAEVTGRNVPHYYLEFKYQRKSKAINFDMDFNSDPKLKDAVRRLIEEVSTTINKVEEGSRK